MIIILIKFTRRPRTTQNPQTFYRTIIYYVITMQWAIYAWIRNTILIILNRKSSVNLPSTKLRVSVQKRQEGKEGKRKLRKVGANKKGAERDQAIKPSQIDVIGIG